LPRLVSGCAIEAKALDGDALAPDTLWSKSVADRPRLEESPVKFRQIVQCFSQGRTPALARGKAFPVTPRGTPKSRGRSSAETSTRKVTMRELEQKIARLEILTEQLRLHLQNLQRTSHDAAEARSKLYGLLQELAELQRERDRRKAIIDFAGA
jgi:hypothetical protein